MKHFTLNLYAEQFTKVWIKAPPQTPAACDQEEGGWEGSVVQGVRRAVEEAKYLFFFFSKLYDCPQCCKKDDQIHSFKDSVNIAHSKYSV